MKKSFLLLPFVVFLVVAGAAYGLHQRSLTESSDVQEAEAGTTLGVQKAISVQIEIGDGGFAPSEVTIAKGSSVTWVNATETDISFVDQGGDPTGPASPVLMPDEMYGFIFTKAGTYTYRSSNGLVGTVNVGD